MYDIQSESIPLRLLFSAFLYITSHGRSLNDGAKLNPKLRTVSPPALFSYLNFEIEINVEAAIYMEYEHFQF